MYVKIGSARDFDGPWSDSSNKLDESFFQQLLNASDFRESNVAFKLTVKKILVVSSSKTHQYLIEYLLLLIYVCFVTVVDFIANKFHHVATINIMKKKYVCGNL